MTGPHSVGGLPTTLTTEEAAELTGFSRTAVWAAARDEGGIVVGDELIRPIRVGRALRWPTRPIAAALGLAGESASTTSSETPVREISLRTAAG